ncbi:MAG: 50S ribosomal protein L9 [Rhodospirillaceae bacterium]|nr:50S ribosomal protein L9 [Rhodospirillaceae bacterium]
MEVILLERIEKLGGMGDVVGVKDGYARNFLLPRKKALRATSENMERFEREREALEQLNSDRRDAASSAATRLEGESIILIRQASDTLQLYGSVSARDIAEAMAERGAEVRRQQVRLDRPIKSLGVHGVRIALHPEVTVTVKVNVARSPEEAEIQARGGTILDELEDEADEAVEDEVPDAPAAHDAPETADAGEAAEPADAGGDADSPSEEDTASAQAE